MGTAPLLMIPGPIEVSPAVREAFSVPPPGHLSPRVIEAFGASLEMMRDVWLADDGSQPFVVAGGGTVAMDMAAANLLEPHQRAVVVNTGYFSDRIAEMLRRQGAEVVEVTATVGGAPSVEEIRVALDETPNVKALIATHVDTSTAVRVDPEPIAALARERKILSIFDGVCATAAETFDMAGWGADVYLTASQKAIGLPPGLALMVASGRALTARKARAAAPPPMYLDWEQWLPIMRAYEERRPSYFSTPATNLILALEVGLREILAEGIERRFARHREAADTVRSAWRALGLDLVPASGNLAANTLSALRYPEGVDATLVGKILGHGVIVAGGLHPAIRDEYFRVGHMGYAVVETAILRRTVEAVAAALGDGGFAFDSGALEEALGRL
jgi:alanine-glyoxylate transaminase/serine-glyoxylate transaminase/serine-pyruvate transaminase